jgi:uncharacterized protein YlxW (UPF0749 family)
VSDVRILPVLAMMAATVFVSACQEDEVACTQADAEKKATELMTKMQEVATTKPEVLAAIAPKAQEIATKLQSSGDDVNAACKALDELMAELNK